MHALAVKQCRDIAGEDALERISNKTMPHIHEILPQSSASAYSRFAMAHKTTHIFSYPNVKLATTLICAVVGFLAAACLFAFDHSHRIRASTAIISGKYAEGAMAAETEKRIFEFVAQSNVSCVECSKPGGAYVCSFWAYAVEQLTLAQDTTRLPRWLFDPSPSTFTTALFGFGISMSIFYQINKGKYQDLSLIIGGFIGALLGWYGSCGQGMLLSLVPWGMMLSLVTCALMHHAVGRWSQLKLGGRTTVSIAA
jgi:hypothetical protein